MRLIFCVIFSAMLLIVYLRNHVVLICLTLSDFEIIFVLTNWKVISYWGVTHKSTLIFHDGKIILNSI